MKDVRYYLVASHAKGKPHTYIFYKEKGWLGKGEQWFYTGLFHPKYPDEGFDTEEGAKAAKGGASRSTIYRQLNKIHGLTEISIMKITREVEML